MEEKKHLYEWLRRNCELISYFNCGIGLFIYGASHTNGVLVVLGIIFVSWGYFIFKFLNHC